MTVITPTNFTYYVPALHVPALHVPVVQHEMYMVYML